MLYERDPDEIYRQSFRIIEAEADLARFSAGETMLATRMIHACGMIEIASDLVFSPRAVEHGLVALKTGARVICDARMVSHGIIARNLPEDTQIECALDIPGVETLARNSRTTRSAAAIERAGDRLEGAIVVIGNAPTALFHLLELIETGRRPALVVGVPVGFVGAAESKEALAAQNHVPFITVHGRRGGSAMAAAAVNALALQAKADGRG